MEGGFGCCGLWHGHSVFSACSAGMLQYHQKQAGQWRDRQTKYVLCEQPPAVHYGHVSSCVISNI